MKTAVSLPDDVFHTAERFAKRARKTRSRLYAEALAEYLARHAPDEVTEGMNRVADELGDRALDPFVSAAATRALGAVDW
jgi:predicted transcriptional regulator